MKIQVRDGLFSFTFEGREVASFSTEKPGRHQWVEMELYWAEPGQGRSAPLLRLPGGGYVTHVIGQSVRAHRHNSSCVSGGLPVAMKDLIAEALPCPDCRPSFPVMKTLRPDRFRSDDEFEQAVAREEARVYAERAGLAGTLSLESPRHSVRRSLNAADLVRHVVGDKLSWPAEQLLNQAAAADPDIKAAIDDPATAIAIQEALVAAGRMVL